MKLSKPEIRSASALASVVGLRMFGLFLILPVFAAYAAHLRGATPLLVMIDLSPLRESIRLPEMVLMAPA